MKRPLLYYSVSVFIGCFSIFVLDGNIFCGAILFVSFLGITFFTLDRKEFIIVCTFFIMGCLNFYMYFNINLINEVEFRVVERKNYYCMASYKGRKVYLLGNTNGLKNGERIKAYGSFKKDINYVKGSIGCYKINFYKNKKEDWIYKICEFKEELFEKYSKELGKKKAALIMGTCYGETKYLSLNQKENFKKLGITHIISVSGFHMAVVYKLLESIFGMNLSLLLSFIYLLFTGAKAATSRAYIMILILKLSKIVYKRYDSLSALGLAGFLLLFIRPYYILDMGFILSFLAALGIILYNKKFQRYLYKLPRKLNESLSITLSAQIFAMPYVMCALNNISLFFIPANLILIPLYSMLVFLGNIVLLIFKIPVIFRFVISILYSLTTAIEGANYILLSICPSVGVYNYFYGVALLGIFMSYLFYKHGYTELKYFPVVLVYFILLYNVI
ncbi:ComEC/Rec2 family competence protein [Clostridium ganghwense]|uniref:ComEC/Rec2 family competence protein n=1 Tax=Clostridium ganghwense TaxID=312089 RepID=A0ABT4CSE5_9CLOT|nr:ComEC/Rec2 family competence protein [Clostridium ganghwense]MCY6371838.1 ComEC/Rec2 family competence protein [Clostridium ganghwense]